MVTSNAPRRYHPALVALHWLIAALIFAEGAIVVSPHFFPNLAPWHTRMQIHMILGVLVLAAVIVRIVVRLATPKPPAASTGNPFFDFIGKVTHASLYLVVIALTATAALSAYQSGMLNIMFGLPPSHHGAFAGRLHVALFLLLGLVIGLHIAAAFFHQLVLRDKLLARMWWARRGRGDAKGAGREPDGAQPAAALRRGLS